MAGRRGIRLALAFVGLFLPGGLVASPDAPPEPSGYRLDDYRAPTPLTVAGARAIDTEEARRLRDAGAAVFIDVLPAPRRPEGLPEGAVWRPRPHLDIPGSVWLPEVGRGALSTEIERWFRARLEALSGADPSRRLVFYCMANCWMSWNAAKRAASWGYKSVDWYGDGVDGWQEAGLPLAPAEPPGDLPR